MYLFGPVPSRRLGRSLGVDIIPYKRCSFNCIYCQLGETSEQSTEIKPYGNLEDFKEEFLIWLKNNGEADYITFAGSGEPTLNSLIKDMILAIQELTDIPVAVLSNGSLFFLKSVRESVMPAQFVKSTLTTSNEKTFRLIHRANPDLTLEKHIEGLTLFREERKSGLYCIEVMIVKGINDTEEEMLGLRELISRIRPDWIDINTPTRPSQNPTISPVEFERLKEIQRILDYPSRILTQFSGEFKHLEISDDKLVEIISRHPDTLENISIMFGMSVEKTREYLDRLVKIGKLSCIEKGKKVSYIAARKGK
ncbi:MAG: radical SAM protein [bacterium]